MRKPARIANGSWARSVSGRLETDGLLEFLLFAAPSPARREHQSPFPMKGPPTLLVAFSSNLLVDGALFPPSNPGGPVQSRPDDGEEVDYDPSHLIARERQAIQVHRSQAE